jgi:glycosyltransferase involved in cell wall biosynthesis
VKKLIIIPAYNEQANILNVIRDIESKVPDFDYIIINDGSTDETVNICEQNNLNVINLPINLGIGGAMQTGYKYALRNGYDFAVQVDGDGQHSSCDILKIYKKMLEENNDIVIGSRFIKKVGFQSTFARRLGISYFSKLIKVLTHQTITDPTSGFRMCGKKVIDFFAKDYPEDYPEPESIVSAIRNKFKVVEIDVSMNERQGGISSISFLKSVYYMIKVTLAILITYSKSSSRIL